MSKGMISLPEPFLEEVDGLAKAERRTRSELVREAIRTYMMTHVIQRTTSDRKAMQQAAKRILSTRLRLPKGETTESIIRRMRDERYGPGWNMS